MVMHYFAFRCATGSYDMNDVGWIGQRWHAKISVSPVKRPTSNYGINAVISYLDIE